MKLVKKISLSFLFFAAVNGGILRAADEETIQIPSDLKTLSFFKDPPKIDGKIDESQWNQGLFLGKFQGGLTEVTASTSAWMGIDKEGLYFAARCEEPFPEKIKNMIVGDQHDAAVWQNDCIEVFIDMGNAHASFFHIVANTQGTVYDAENLNGREYPVWESNAIVKTSLGKKSWDIEFMVPFAPLRHALKRGEIFSVNMGRERYAGSAQELSSLARGRFGSLREFLPILAGGPLIQDKVSLISLRRGPFNAEDAGRWNFIVQNDAAQVLPLEIQFPRQKGAAAQSYKMKSGINVLSVEIPSGKGEELAEISVSMEGKTLYQSENRVGEISGGATGKVSKTKNPVFEGMLQPRPQGLSQNGAMCWAPEMSFESAENLALQYGTPFSYDSIFKNCAEEHLMPILTSSIVDPKVGGRWSGKHAVKPYLEKYHVPYLLLVDYRQGAKEAGAPMAGGDPNGGSPWRLDPRSIKSYLEDAQRDIDLGKQDPALWGLGAGDEAWEQLHLQLLWFCDHHSAYPEFDAAHEEVKAKFGFGKYGFPESSHDINPYRWIATYRWELSKMLDMERQLQAMIKKECPRLKMISWDNQAAHLPNELGRWKEVFDVMTHQLYPSSNPNREEFGFLTKLAHDLSGMEEIWPCPHTEHYGDNFSVPETEELISQVFRNGATGLHLYPNDTLGALSLTKYFIADRFGAPERWSVVRTATAMIHQPFQVKQDPPDVAIFYSNPSYQGQGSKTQSNEPEWIYTLLGPRLGSSFVFIDELQCRASPDALGKFKVIYVPYAPIVDDEEWGLLKGYVQKGGTLVVCDPLAFRRRSDGSDREDPDRLLPLGNPTLTEETKLNSSLAGAEGQLPAFGHAYTFNTDHATALATFDDGSPAIFEKQAGRGKIIYFGANPLQSLVIADKKWIDFFRNLQISCGATLDHAAWRFRIPKTIFHDEVLPGKTCLTGNYVQWRLSEPVPKFNSKSSGSYTVTEKADNCPDEPAHTEIPFEKGRLTDRLRAVKEHNNLHDPSQWVCQWKHPKPFSITYHLDQPAPISAARLFFDGVFPAGICELSADGKIWRQVQTWTASEDTEKDVLTKEISWKPEKAAYVRLTFNPENDLSPLTLAETEIWGEE